MRILFLLAAALLALGSAPASAKTRCLMIAEAVSGDIVHAEGEQCDEGMGPASTFKLALAVIGFDDGVLVDADNPAWPYKGEYDALRPADRATTTPRRWLTESVLWFSRKLVAELGPERFASYVANLDYGNADVSGDPGADNGLTHSWLNSSLQITPRQQAIFVRRLVLGDLPVVPGVREKTIEALPKFDGGGGWTITGKTGTGYLRTANGTLGKRQFGWFVGFGEREGASYVFAYLIEDEKAGGTAAGPRARDDLLGRWSGLVK